MRNKSLKILVCPLNWGLGHASRCVPIIQQLINEGHTPILVADGYPLALLRQEFPTLRTIEYPSYSISYSKSSTQIFAMLRSFPAIVSGILKEYFWLNKLLKQEHFDQVISDNRFGMWNKNIHSIYITHQLMVKMPLLLKPLEPFVWWIHRQFILQYNECWVPDFENQNNSLSGDLSHLYPLPKNAKFIEPLSRFSSHTNVTPNCDYAFVAVLSGIEKQRSKLELQLIKRFEKSGTKALIVRGLPVEKELWASYGNVQMVSHLPTEALAAVILGAKLIIARSGYSSLMDLKALNCLHKAELIPTPGQTEQIYLASYHKID